MDPITSVMRAMTDSVSNVKLATVSMAVFRQAKGRGDEQNADRAGFSADSMPGAIQASQASQEALLKAQAEVQAQENLRWRRLRQEAQARNRERMRQALRNAREEAMEADDEGEERDSAEHPSAQPDDRRAERAGEASAEPAQGANPAGVVYTQLGEVKPKSADKKLTVTA